MTAWPEPVTTASVWPALPSQTMSSTIGTCHAWGGGGVTLSSLVEVTCISNQYQVSGQSGVGFLVRYWDGEHYGVFPNTSGSSGAIPAHLVCVGGVDLSVDIYSSLLTI